MHLKLPNRLVFLVLTNEDSNVSLSSPTITHVPNIEYFTLKK